FKPRMITAVHCETPSGTLNPLEELGRLKHAYRVPLFYVDTVAGAGGVPVLADDWHIDLCLGGSQKCLSAPPDMSFLSVSPRAWEIIDAVGYVGYDALKPFQHAVENRFFPYTPSWQGVAALYTAAGLLLDEGLENSYNRHDAVARFCRRRLVEMGIDLFPAPGAIPSPTVTAATIPQGFSWQTWDRRLREKGLVVAGSYGPLAEKVFRLGHMGSQADQALVEQAIRAIADAL
ncbi:MAG: aminotransferase class V-fold PLP-dependent enzyme, partial [Desulfobacteraceae bacterium]|nr:aminotransferase class V-fold PLP-dependent enzyme [Desulfobacteraceae bacterium]